MRFTTQHAMSRKLRTKNKELSVFRLDRQTNQKKETDIIIHQIIIIIDFYYTNKIRIHILYIKFIINNTYLHTKIQLIITFFFLEKQ